MVALGITGVLQRLIMHKSDGRVLEELGTELEDKLASMQASIVAETEAKSQLLEQQQREMQAEDSRPVQLRSRMKVV